MIRLVLGLRPGSGVKYEICDSSTTRRLDSLMPDWRTQFQATNLYSSSEPDECQDFLDRLRIYRMIQRDEVRVIVALGLEASKFAAPQSVTTPWLSWISVGYRYRMLKFPHPSGLNRWWNLPEHREAAALALQYAATRTGLP